MSGTHEGSKRSSETMKRRYGMDVFKRIGALGGSMSYGGGWTGDPEAAQKAGKKGGSIGKIGYKYIRSTRYYRYYINKKTNQVVRFKIDT